MSEAANKHLNDWLDREAMAEAMIPLIGRLYRENNVVTGIYGRQLVNQSAIDILKAHRFARQVDEVELPISETLPLVQALTSLDLGAASIDLARLNNKFKASGGAALEDFLREELADVVGKQGQGRAEPQDVVLYGFGRIGRLLARIMVGHASSATGLRLRAIVVRRGKGNDLAKRASLLRRDSVHGPFAGSIRVDEQNSAIIANGTYIKVIYANSPEEVDYTAHGIQGAVVVDNTGIWRDEEGLGQHLRSKGAARVLLTAPGRGEIKNIVYGVNHTGIEETDTLLSAASCTTNAITPVAKLMHEKYRIDHGHVETVHSYTNDQNLIDNFHKGERRGRSAALNMVLTETGAAKAVAKALPELAGKLSGNAIRVPTPNVSMAILNLELERETTKEELNRFLRRESLEGPLAQQVDYIDSAEVVSTDFVGSTAAGVVDGLATIVNGKQAILYVWYDNEYGYSAQVVRVLEHIAQSEPPKFPRV
ncbi:glyceraldehyde-3-phosphate dehydrogenase [Nesterenkonia alkaliphila]|uniref:Glyceraldehyde-3-phosphate dehydrogenase n=1 Tax=Nesterenkonia alkaliphila TaxID=1463631 RepID=A0A7K1UM41_9MICC|nr:glyceraldehyde-3-phosphate dehydrogenase [Nesterenkonia alkaliphila]MVT27549.1 glyceraldehyde-3-phosphate dehydrogenase [Nesterenkonia alkaliphila]GFZ80190.1 glyceraldehyde-3-phosphate dehydrogenase [Nesterenkonia alkaliphila]